jgi:hypothetical protein
VTIEFADATASASGVRSARWRRWAWPFSGSISIHTMARGAVNPPQLLGALFKRIAELCDTLLAEQCHCEPH